MRFLIKILLVTPIVLTVFKTANTQTLTITNVSVINNQGHVRISWEYNGSDNLEIFRDSLEINNLSPLQVITNSSVKTFIDYTAQAHLKPRSYKIQSETTSSISSDKVSTFHLTFDYDSCLQQVNLEWEDLETTAFTANDWTPNQFAINTIENGTLTRSTIDASNLEYAVQSILENTNYTFFIETIWQGKDSTSYSNPVDKFTLMPQSPDYINSISASNNGGNTDLRFEISSNSELRTYKILKSGSLTGNFDTLETVNTSNFTITSTDVGSDPDNTISYYKLVSLNDCGHERANSDIMNNIVLEVENDEFINTLTWNLFKEYKMVPVVYEIYRITNNAEPELIRTFQNFNTINDDVEDLQGEQYSGQFCYFIRTYEQSLSSDYYSQSNIVCVYLNPQVYIPEAFTPNDDGVNDLFKPVFTFLPDNYELKIYNRWGNLVFESRDPSKEWNGTASNGSKVPAGAYMYYLKMKTEENQSFEKRGNITIIYP